VAAGWLPNGLRGRRGLIIAGGVLSIPALWLMGRVRAPWELAAVSAMWCFWSGMTVALVNVLAGLSAAHGTRGKVFGILSLNAGLGALLGGLAVGPIIERWGYPALFAVLASFALLWPIAASFLQNGNLPQARSSRVEAAQEGVRLGRSFYFLLLGSLAATLAAYVFIVGRSLVMARLGLGATAISATSALSEVPILPLPLLLGRLSDRFGRKPFLILGYLAASGGLLGLAAAASVWHFWISSTLITASLITGAVGTALVTDVLPKETLSKGLTLFGATTWIAGILGCVGAGYAMEHLGSVATFVSGALLPVAATALLLAIRPADQRLRSHVLASRTPLSAGLLPASP
jgi:hypothetical protein